MIDNERIQEISKSICTDVPELNKREQFLLDQLEQRDKEIAELRAESDRYDLYEAEMAQFRQEYSILLSALEQIENCTTNWDTPWAKRMKGIARDTIAQVRGGVNSGA